MYLFLTSNIFIEKFTHVWAIFFMEMSRCKRGNLLCDVFVYRIWRFCINFYLFYLLSFDFSYVFFQMDMFNAFGNYIFYEFKVIHHSWTFEVVCCRSNCKLPTELFVTWMFSDDYSWRNLQINASVTTSSFLNFGDLLQKKYALRKVWGWPKYFRKNQMETMKSTKSVIFYFFLTSNIFIEEFTHAWVIFVMIISRLKRGNPLRDRLQTAIDRLRNGYNYMALSLSCSSKWIWVTLKSRVVIPPH